MGWSQRDIELNLRNKLAQLVAEKTSGVKGALPEQDDYRIADQLAVNIDRLTGFTGSTGTDATDDDDAIDTTASDASQGY